MTSGSLSTSRLVEFRPGIAAHASGALWLGQARAVLVADVHLGYGWAMRRRGQLGPVQDGGIVDRLRELIKELSPNTIVFLGDLVHAPNPCPAERDFITGTLRELRASSDIIVVRGNHDRAFARDFADLDMPLREEWRLGNLAAVHGDGSVPTADPVVVGHHHPAFTIRDHAGVGQKLPILLASSRAVALPAFSPFAAGVDVSQRLTPGLGELFGRQPVCGIIVTGRRAVEIGPVPKPAR